MCESLPSISRAPSPVPLRRRFTELFCRTLLSPHLSLGSPFFKLTPQVFLGQLVPSVSYRTGNNYLCVVRLLHIDLGQSDPLIVTHHRVYVLRGITMRQAQFPKFSLHMHPPRIRSLRISWRSFALRRTSPTVKALLDWTVFRTASFGFLRISDLHFPHRPASTKQGISAESIFCNTTLCLQSICDTIMPKSTDFKHFLQTHYQHQHVSCKT